jgi:long-chain fatty acid transport protein
LRNLYSLLFKCALQIPLLRFLLLALFLSSVFCLIPTPASAQAPRIQGQGTAASGMGNAFAAQADDPSALHYNAAGMTQLPGVQISGGGLLSGGTTKFTSAAGATSTGDRDGAFAWPPPAHGFLTINLKDVGVTAFGDLTVGLGATTPLGSISRYPDDGPLRFKTTFTALPLIDIKPTIAYKVTQNLSLGLGADIYTFSGLLGEGQFEKHFISPGGPVAPLFGPAGSRVELNGKDTALGYNASLLYTALRNADGKPIANIAFVYRSEATLDLAGGLLVNGVKRSDVTASFVLPRVISGGIAVWPVRSSEREWKLELDVDYVGWKSVRNLDIHLANGIIVPQPLNWRSTYTIMVGTEHRWLHIESLPDWEVAVRAGYTNSPSQVPDSSFDPGIASGDVHIPSIGFGLLCKKGGSLLGLVRCGEIGIGPVMVKAIGFDFSYQISIYEERTVTCGCSLPIVNGQYQTTYHTGGFSFRASF